VTEQELRPHSKTVDTTITANIRNVESGGTGCGIASREGKKIWEKRRDCEARLRGENSRGGGILDVAAGVERGRASGNQFHRFLRKKASKKLRGRGNGVAELGLIRKQMLSQHSCMTTRGVLGFLKLVQTGEGNVCDEGYSRSHRRRGMIEVLRTLFCDLVCRGRRSLRRVWFGGCLGQHEG